MGGWSRVTGLLNHDRVYGSRRGYVSRDGTKAYVEKVARWRRERRIVLLVRASAGWRPSGQARGSHAAVEYAEAGLSRWSGCVDRHAGGRTIPLRLRACKVERRVWPHAARLPAHQPTSAQRIRAFVLAHRREHARERHAAARRRPPLSSNGRIIAPAKRDVIPLAAFLVLSSKPSQLFEVPAR